MNERFARAMEVVVTELKQLPPVTGILFFGSAQRGEETRSSDLDLYAIVAENERWHRGRLVEGVEVELSFGPAHFWRERMESGNAVITHAFASGTVISDRTGELAMLTQLGKQLWSAGPRPLSAAHVQSWRYRISDLIRDLEDLPPHGPEAVMLAGALVSTSLEAYCALHAIWPAKPKRSIGYLQGHNHGLGERLTTFYQSGVPAAMAIQIADDVLAPFGGRILEYETDKVPC